MEGEGTHRSVRIVPDEMRQTAQLVQRNEVVCPRMLLCYRLVDVLLVAKLCYPPLPIC